MCNIAGYIGSKKAAPILFEMIKKQDGYAGGYYAGIATVHEGVIRCEKLIGSVERLEEVPDAKNIPGTVGVIHSRSNAGGGDEWAHPFLGTWNGKVISAYAAVGCNGFFTPRREEFNVIAKDLYNSGFKMLSSTHKVESEIYPTMPDGAKVHMSDVMCQLVLKHIVNGCEGDSAMANAFCEMPGEIIGLNISVNDGNRIAWAKISEALFVSFADHGAYISSSPEGIPDDGCSPIMLPANSSGFIYCDHYTVTPFKNPPCRVSEADAGTLHKVYDRIVELLSEKEYAFYPLWDVIKPELAGADCYQISTLLFSVLCTLKKEGRLNVNTVWVPGEGEGLTAKQFMLSIKK